MGLQVEPPLNSHEPRLDDKKEQGQDHQLNDSTDVAVLLPTGNSSVLTIVHYLHSLAASGWPTKLTVSLIDPPQSLPTAFRPVEQRTRLKVIVCRQ